MPVRKPEIDEQRIRNALTAKRNLLFDAFSKDPSNTPLALELRTLDDLIADLQSRRKTPGSCLDSKSVSR